MRVLEPMTWIISGALALSAGCSNYNVAVDAKSEGLATYQSKQGGLNTPGFALGDVVAVDPQTHEARKIASVQVDPTELAMTPTSAATSEPFASTFDLGYSQKVSNTMQSSVDEKVRGETNLHVEGCFTRSIKNPAVFVAGNYQLARTVEKAGSKYPKAHFFLVSAVTSADKLFLSFDDQQSDFAKIGQYQFQISFPQNEQLEKIAKDSTAFFKVTPLKVDTENGFAVVADKESGDRLPVSKFEGAVASTN